VTDEFGQLLVAQHLIQAKSRTREHAWIRLALGNQFLVDIRLSVHVLLAHPLLLLTMRVSQNLLKSPQIDSGL